MGIVSPHKFAAIHGVVNHFSNYHVSIRQRREGIDLVAVMTKALGDAFPDL